MTTPIDRESVERLTFNACADAANLNNGFPFRGEMAATVQELAHTAIALRAALDEAEAQTASAAQEARAVALQETEDAVRAWLYECPTHESLADVILGLMGSPAAEALERVRAEERAKGMERAGAILLDHPHWTRWHVLEAIRAETAAIRARGET